MSDPELFGRHVAKLNATNNSLVRAYVWGLDLSETLDDAGGVSGLLWVRNGGGPASGTHFVCYDGNGNVWNLVSATTGTEAARYEYGPFGEPLRLSGPGAKANPFRFSTKRTEEFTRLVLYEYRAYSPASGRWLSRDAIGERGGVNLYCALLNNPVGSLDVLGASSKKKCETCQHLKKKLNRPESARDELWVLDCMIFCDHVCQQPGVPSPQKCLEACYSDCEEYRIPSVGCVYRPPSKPPGRPAPNKPPKFGP